MDHAVGGASSLIRVRGLRKSFHGAPVVMDVDLSLATNEIMGLVGPNGAGKTTTLRLLAGLLRPDAGAGLICGRPVDRRASADPAIGYMSQKAGLYADLTVEQNLAFRAEVYRVEAARRAVDEVVAAHGLGDKRRARVGDLSGGWARRVQFAATLLPCPKVLLLDEPTAGLDARSRQALWRSLVAYARTGAGVIVNTHDMEEAELCDRVALFRAGRVVAQGRPAQLVAAAALAAGLIEDDIAPARLRDEFGLGPQVCITSRGRGVRVVGPAAVYGAMALRLSLAGVTLTPDRPGLADVALASEEAAAFEAAA